MPGDLLHVPHFSNSIALRICSSLTILLFLPMAVLVAQDGDEAVKKDAAAGQYQWEMTGPAKAGDAAAQPPAAAAQTKDGISPEAYDKVVSENMKLRQDNAALKRLSEDAGRINSDLAEKVRALEAAPKAEGKSDSGAALATTLEENLTLQEQNRTLQAEVTRLRAEVGRLQARGPAAKTGQAVSEKSDLFKRLQDDNARLTRELQQYKQTVKQTSEAGNKSAMAGTEAKRRVQALEEENALLRKVVLKLDKQVLEAAEAKDKLAAAQMELGEKDKRLADAEREAKKKSGVHDNVAQAAREIEDFRKQRGDLLFNLGVLYSKVGMYDDAVASFRKVLETQAGASDVHFNLGVIYDKHLSDRRKAEYHYKKFLELDPLSKDADRVKLWLLELEISG